MRIYFWLIIVLLFNYSMGYAQTTRPKIGLVLSGGGARGMAHIGVLKYMEEAGLRPDYITGTSMGSIIGGLYACGYSAAELDSLVKHVDWSRTLTNSIQLNDINIEEKPFYGRYIAEVPVSRKFKFGLPNGLIEGQALHLLLSRLTKEVHGINDFNQLPIPFACVAADIAEGKEVVLNSGNLALAMRASMAIPTVFTPVEIDDKLLIDGGILRNYPVQEVIDMGADIVIGVFVSDDLLPKEDLQSMTAVLAQAMKVTSVYDTREQAKLTDINILPDLSGFSTGSFSNGADIVSRGEAAGQLYFEQFKSLADSLNDLGPQAAVVRPPTRDIFKINRVQVHGDVEIMGALIEGKLHIEEDASYSIPEIEKQIKLVYGTRYFESVRYELIPSENEGYDLHVTLVESMPGKFMFALHYDSENGAGINFNLIQRNLLLPNSRIQAEVDLAEQFRVNVSYLKYLGKSQHWAGSVGYEFANNELPSFSNGKQTALYAANANALSARIFSAKSSTSSYGAGFRHEFTKLNTKIRPEESIIIESLSSQGNVIEGFYLRNSTNYRYFPTHGTFLNARIKYKFNNVGKGTVLLVDSLGQESLYKVNDIEVPEFWAMEINSRHYLPISHKSTLISGFGLVVSNLSPDLNVNVTDYYLIGGFRSKFSNSQEFAGLNKHEYGSIGQLYLQVEYQYQLFQKIYLNAKLNYVDVEYPNTWLFPDREIMSMDQYNRRFGGGLSLAYSSPLGPISVAIATDQYHSNPLLFLGIGFFY